MSCRAPSSGSKVASSHGSNVRREYVIAAVMPNHRHAPEFHCALSKVPACQLCEGIIVLANFKNEGAVDANHSCGKTPDRGWRAVAIGLEVIASKSTDRIRV